MFWLHDYASVGSVFTRLGAVALLGLFVLGCSYAKGPPYAVEGQRFPDDRVSLVAEGMSAAKVRQILGQPYRIETSETGERWRYYVWQRQDETVRYLGLIPVKKPLYSGVKEATVVLRDGVVQEVSFRHTRLE